MNTALVKIDVASAYLGRSVNNVCDLVDGGNLAAAGLLWVFNLAHNPAGPRRDLRFWRTELLARAGGHADNCGRLQINQVIAQILPARREHFQAGEVDQLFQIRPSTRKVVDAELKGRLVCGRNVYQRTRLETFLHRRRIGRLKATKELTRDSLA